MNKYCILASMALVAFACPADNGPLVRRIFREARVTRGNTNVQQLQPIDTASWLALPEGDFVFAKFRRAFDVAKTDGKLVLDVSADERFYLTLDGTFVARGPNRGTVENWQYQTYEIEGLKPGRHVLEAYVWRIGEHGPLAQLSNGGGFVLKANEAFDKRLTTGVAEWEVGRLDAVKPNGTDNGAWGTGDQYVVTGTGPYAGEPSSYAKATEVRGGAGFVGSAGWGIRTRGWMLFPSQLPDQTETRVAPGRIVAVSRTAKWREAHTYVADETKDPLVDGFNALLKGRALVIPARTRVQAAWDLGRYHCAYPSLRTTGGRGARVSWTFTESSRDMKTGRKGQRDALVGKALEGYGEVFVPTGGAGDFSAPWFRCGRWCRIDVETGDEPLTIESAALVESRYPMEEESAFVADGDRSFGDVRRICTRAMQMCDHEMLFDCPFYEQQMYPGDSRVQLLVLSALSRDERMIRRVIEIYDLATRDDGMCPMNFPTRGIQESLTYTLCYLCMYGDYVMNHADRAWLRARLPGLRKSMAGVAYYENADGLVANPPGWSFMDWVVGWEGNGTVPGTFEGEGLTSELNLFWLLSMQSAAMTERALGDEDQARYWEKRAERLKQAIVKTFWSEARGLVADNPKKNTFSEHSQCLALLADALPADKAAKAAEHLVTDADLKRCTVYFSYYLFETYFKIGRGDLFLKRLDLWRDYVKLGVTTLLEMPEDAQRESRSDCHAWGAHPVWFMQAGLAGIRSDAPFFAKVRVAPCPGDLKELKARHPHPQGFVEVDLKFSEGRAKGTVKTPVPGTFVYGGRTVGLVSGTNTL